jgi:hypothetical protein
MIVSSGFVKFLGDSVRLLAPHCNVFAQYPSAEKICAILK